MVTSQFQVRLTGDLHLYSLCAPVRLLELYTFIRRLFKAQMLQSTLEQGSGSGKGEVCVRVCVCVHTSILVKFIVCMWELLGV